MINVEDFEHLRDTKDREKWLEAFIQFHRSFKP